MAQFVSCLILVLLVSGLNVAQSVTSGCQMVFDYFPDCLEFLVGDYYKPSLRCCKHVVKLNILAKHRIGPRWICFCIELMVKGKQPPLKGSRIAELPKKCHTHLSFPISDSMDCDKV